MKDIATLAIPTTTLCRLLQYAEAHQSETNAGELAALAIEEWLARAAEDGVPARRNPIASRSAWAEVRLLFPGENHWKLADTHRCELARLAPSKSGPAPAAGALPAQAAPMSSSVQPAPTHRLPRIPPIPTQGRLQPDIHALTAADRGLLQSPDRRKAYRRQEDLLLD